MVSDRHIWKFKTVSYLFPLVMGIISILLNYRITRTSGLATQDSPSFPVLLSILIPIIVIWIIATHGAVQLKTYAYSIKNSPDGKSLNHIANGLLWLVVYITILSTTSAIESLLVNTSYLHLSVFLGNHIPIVIALISVHLLFIGSKDLAGILRRKLTLSRRMIIFGFFTALFYVAFIWRFYQSVPHLEPVNGIPKFALSVDALLFTYVLPHLALWMAGVLACRNLAHYATKTPGSIYKSLFGDLSKGILLVYVCTFISQIFIISTVSYSSVNLGVILIYGLLILATIGFVLIARGANKLTRIETIE